MPNYTTTVGNVQLLALNDGGPVRSPLIPFPDTTIEQWREFPELLDEHDQVRSRYGTTGVRSQGKLIIVDTGLQAPDGTLMTDMRAKGVDPEAVDLVVHTHLHPDHVGWNLTDGKPNFPNARYLVPRKDWDYWTQPDVLAGATHVRDQVMPLEGLGFIDLIDDDLPDHRRAGHGFHARAYPGPRLDHDCLGRRAGLHPGRRGAQPGAGALHRLVPHLRHPAGRVPEHPAFGAGHAGERADPGLRRTLSRPRVRPFRPGRGTALLAGHLTSSTISVIPAKAGIHWVRA